ANHNKSFHICSLGCFNRLYCSVKVNKDGFVFSGMWARTGKENNSITTYSSFGNFINIFFLVCDNCFSSRIMKEICLFFVTDHCFCLKGWMVLHLSDKMFSDLTVCSNN